ncbi:MAG: Crp/Fnr family transcriptional regulator [Gammaproteobacteria bacterium]
MADQTTGEILEEKFRNSPHVQTLNIRDKGLIYRQGALCTQVFLIGRGIVKLYHVSSVGNALTTALLSRGNLLGCLEDWPTTGKMEETALALGEVLLYRCDHHHFRSLLVQQADIAWQIFAQLSKRRRQAERKLRSALTESVETRVIDTLKELSGIFGIPCTHGYSLEIHLTQQELADLVGAHRSVVSTIMNNLRLSGLLDYTRFQICIHDKAFNEFRDTIDSRD